MKQYNEVVKIVHKNLESKCPGYSKQKGYQHLYGITTLCIELALIRGLDTDLAATIGILHDYATYYTASSFDHANRSAMLAKDIVIDIYAKEEIDIICTAIKNHSNKQNIDDAYSKLIKDADTWYSYLFEPDQVFSLHKQQRIDALKPFCIIKE